MQTNRKLKVIVTGASGMVGEGVAHECVLHPSIESVLIVTRRPSGIVDPKVKEIIVKDFFNLGAIENELIGYDACFFCLGVSSVGMSEADYTKVTHDLTLNFANTVSRLNSEMTFEFISGGSTDSTEKGKIMWARVKGRTENDLMKLPFAHVYNFRPGYMHPTKGMKHTLVYYKYLSWLYPILRTVVPNHVSTLAELGLSMINAALVGYEKNIIEVVDIKELSAL